MSVNICIRLGRRIRKLRTERGWGQAYLAELSGLGKTYISQVENGHKAASILSLEALATSFGMTVSELLRGV